MIHDISWHFMTFHDISWPFPGPKREEIRVLRPSPWILAPDLLGAAEEALAGPKLLLGAGDSKRQRWRYHGEDHDIPWSQVIFWDIFRDFLNQDEMKFEHQNDGDVNIVILKRQATEDLFTSTTPQGFHQSSENRVQQNHQTQRLEMGGAAPWVDPNCEWIQADSWQSNLPMELVTVKSSDWNPRSFPWTSCFKPEGASNSHIFMPYIGTWSRRPSSTSGSSTSGSATWTTVTLLFVTCEEILLSNHHPAAQGSRAMSMSSALKTPSTTCS